MSIKVAINGFGRIGRLVARHLRARDGFDLVAVNDLTSPDMLGYLFAHDSVHGPYRGTVEVDGSDLIIDLQLAQAAIVGANGSPIHPLEIKKPSMPWGELKPGGTLQVKYSAIPSSKPTPVRFACGSLVKLRIKVLHAGGVSGPIESDLITFSCYY